MQIRLLALFLLFLLFAFGAEADDIYKCSPPLDSEEKAIECAMWHSRVISELSLTGYKYTVAEKKDHWAVAHTNMDKNGSTYEVIVNREDGELIELRSK
jgi:hypothetical protein